jgi:ACR3 family arsenite efflux pump ArsB
MEPIESGKFIEKTLLCLLAIIILFDIYLYLNETKGDTISNILKIWVYDKFFFITYIWGVLAGHFFLGSNRSIFNNSNWDLIIVLEIALILLVFGMFFKVKVKSLGQIILLIIGVSVGHFFWSLN